MSATLTMTHKSIGVEVRRAPYEVIVDGQRVGEVAMNASLSVDLEPGRHSLQVRSGRKSSSVREFAVTDGATIAYRCTGKRPLPLFLASFLVPRLALAIVPQ